MPTSGLVEKFVSLLEETCRARALDEFLRRFPAEAVPSRCSWNRPLSPDYDNSPLWFVRESQAKTLPNFRKRCAPMQALRRLAEQESTVSMRNGLYSFDVLPRQDVALPAADGECG
jgi:hypothetical protein